MFSESESEFIETESEFIESGSGQSSFLLLIHFIYSRVA